MQAIFHWFVFLIYVIFNQCLVAQWFLRRHLCLFQVSFFQPYCKIYYLDNQYDEPKHDSFWYLHGAYINNILIKSENPVKMIRSAWVTEHLLNPDTFECEVVGSNA